MARRYKREQIELAKELLRTASLPRDALPYTDEFSRLYTAFGEQGGQRLDRHTFWRLLTRAGKEGGARNRSKAPPTPAMSQEHAFEILRLCPEGIGSRDRLPYTTEFDEMHRRFVAHTGSSISKSDFWRVLSRLAKRSRKPKALDISVTPSGISAALEENLLSMNPWWTGEAGIPIPPHRRSVFPTIYRSLTEGAVPVLGLRGPRQVGKTTLQKQVIDVLLRTGKADIDRILLVQFDDLPSLEGLAEPVLRITKWYQKQVLKKSLNQAARDRREAYLFFDEIQDLPAWEAQMKHLVDHHACRAFVTGSSALRIQSGRDSLAGRIELLSLRPLRLAEISNIREDLASLPAFRDVVNLQHWADQGFWEELSGFQDESSSHLDRAFDEFSEMGGYPRCHHPRRLDWQDAATYLNGLVVERTIDHDLRTGGVARDKSVLREVFRLAMRYAGQAPSLKTLGGELSVLLGYPIKPSIVADHLRFLENSLLVRMIEPLQIRLKKQPTPSKICVCDHAVRAAWLQEKISLTRTARGAGGGGSSDLAGRIIESIIGYFLTGFSGLGVAHFPARSREPEVDFILTIGATRVPIEVKFRSNPLKPENLAGIRSFLAKPGYDAKFGIVITRNVSHRMKDIVAVPAKKFLLLG